MEYTKDLSRMAIFGLCFAITVVSAKVFGVEKELNFIIGAVCLYLALALAYGAILGINYLYIECREKEKVPPLDRCIICGWSKKDLHVH